MPHRRQSVLLCLAVLLGCLPLAIAPAQVTVTHPSGDEYLLIDNSTGAPAYSEPAGSFGEDTGQPDSWNGDRR